MKKKSLLAVLVLLLAIHVQAQNLIGAVYRAGTDSIIPHASVYYSGSSIGVSTNAEGHFALPVTKALIPLVVSCVGYASTIINEYTISQPMVIYLNPKQQVLKDVLVMSDGLTRQEKEALFISEFIGTSVFAQSCTIANLDDVNLRYHKKDNILSASCDTPIIIKNAMLGYTIHYYLDTFVHSPKRIVYSGNFVFKENNESNDIKQIRRNREQAYLGSRMQFIRALWHNELRKFNFTIYRKNIEIKADSVMLDSAERKYLNTKQLLVVYKNDNSTATSMLVRQGKPYIDKNGFYSTNITWNGFMAKARIGDMLPYEYESPSDPKPKVKDITTVVAQKTHVQPKQVAVTYAKKSDSEFVRLFKSIVLQKSRQDSQLVVKKWQRPIYYKIVGSVNVVSVDKELNTYLDAFFKQLTQVTGLEINKASTDNQVNFLIMIDKPVEYPHLVPDNILRNLQTNQPAALYYVTDKEEIVKATIQINTQSIDEYGEIWESTRFQVVKALGFFNNNPTDFRSLFYSGYINWKPEQEISWPDKAILKTLYAPKVKSGMSGAQLTEVLAKAKL